MFNRVEMISRQFKKTNALFLLLFQIDRMCILVTYASIGLSDDLSLAVDQASGHLILISLKLETDIGVSCESMGSG